MVLQQVLLGGGSSSASVGRTDTPWSDQSPSWSDSPGGGVLGIGVTGPHLGPLGRTKIKWSDSPVGGGPLSLRTGVSWLVPRSGGSDSPDGGGPPSLRSGFNGPDCWSLGMLGRTVLREVVHRH